MLFPKRSNNNLFTIPLIASTLIRIADQSSRSAAIITDQKYSFNERAPAACSQMTVKT